MAVMNPLKLSRRGLATSCAYCDHLYQFLRSSRRVNVVKGFSLQRTSRLQFSTSSRQSNSPRSDDSGGPNNARIVPASAGYFSTLPTYIDDFLHIDHLVRRYWTLPLASSDKVPRVSWKTAQQYKAMTGEDVGPAKYSRLLNLARRLHSIDRSVFPKEVEEALVRYRRDVKAAADSSRRPELDMFGRSYGSGRRKSSSAEVFLVEGEGEVMINGKPLREAFPRIHDRESALWPLKCTSRIDKYNAFVIVRGGGTTGQAEAVTLGLARALLVHEPLLKPALRRAGVVTRDARRVERKKPGHVKARKMPAWVAR